MPPSLLSLMEGVGGTVHGSFFRAPAWVDLEKKPGATRIPPQVGSKSLLPDVLVGYVTLAFFFYSPNLVWFLIASLIWILFPYDMIQEESSSFEFQQVWRQRLAINYVTVVCFYGFWHLSLYWWNMSSRPFVANRQYSWSKVFHNFVYTSLGALQWTFVEVAFLYGYATGRLDYYYISNNAVASSSYRNLLCTCGWVLFVPIIRDVHFYFCHRFLHLKFLYKYIHQVHHRNSDIEPFAGMSMHPTEHLYYFTCYGPLLWFPTTVHPFIVLWMGMHVMLSPAASHSGYEDHWQADLYHYLHHRYFECNYASTGLPMDHWFGTYRDRLEVSSSTPIKDAKTTLYGTPEHVGFWILGVLVPIGIITMALVGGTTDEEEEKPLFPYVSLLFQRHKVMVALLVAMGPIAAAMVLHGWGRIVSQTNHTTTTASSSTKKYSLFSPFQEDSTLSLVLHTVMGGGICCVLPLYCLIRMLLEEQ